MKKLNCIVVDDDEMIRLDLEKKIDKNPYLNFVGSCPSALVAVEIMMQVRVDLVFLDILMPGMTGLQFLKSLSSDHPQIIFVTSEKDFAAEAFEYEVTDFLVKPVSEDRFLKAVMRASSIYNVSVASIEHSNCLFVKVNSCLVKIVMNEILYVEAQADYLTIHRQEQRLTIHSTMKNIQGSLPDSQFFRIHNSFIVNLAHISQIEDNMVMVNKKLLPVSRSRIKPLLQRINLIS